MFEAREAKGWSQERLSRESGVSRVTVSKWESGQIATPKMVTIRKLAKALNLPVGALLHPLAEAAAEAEVRAGLILAAGQWAREVSGREDLSGELAEVALERLEGLYGDGFDFYHSQVAAGVSDDELGGLADALAELVAAMNEIADAALRQERDPDRRGRLVDMTAHQRRVRPEIPHRAAG